MIICFKAFLAQTNFARCYTTTKNIAITDYNFFYGVKLPREVCVHHIEHETVLLTVEEICFCMIVHQIHQLLHMQECSFDFNGSILGIYPIELWLYQNDLDTTTLKNSPLLTKDITIEETIVFVVSSRILAWLLFMISNNKMIWKLQST